ncbi:Nucleotide-diphospho-sugar transferase [Poseidonocella pacifica]|uniref:Nucleotide-diphospho-sugar transferase n=1 Tax=Poseidonocella pacifica TaxID=871651 RepID=A0A1I0WAJ1_9RHOB|nr:putative nucleotide-diphospho-sugar transferase [Poseidonocella pacifica]SFA85033.1 Nucleotide-diphospho-sugar transferase [Poseidonocella pacifica]
MSLKLIEALDRIRDGVPVIYSDVDAIWRQDPIAQILTLDVDFAFQPASFPQSTKQAWGFSVCTGFFFMRPCAAVETLLHAAVERFDGSDQRTINEVLLSDFDVDWAERPAGWRRCSLEGGWTAPILGECRKTGLRLAALPHS